MRASPRTDGFLRHPVGTVRVGEPYVVTEDAVVAFADATSDDVDHYRRSGTAPPLFASVAAEDSHVGLMLELVPVEAMVAPIHLGHDVTFERPLRVGETVRSRAELVETRQTPFGFSLCLEVELTGEDGGRAVIAYHRVLFRSVRDSVSAGAAPVPPRPRRHELTRLGEVEVEVSEDQSLRYAAASGDNQLIHTDVDVARQAGFPGLILHGMCTLAFLAAAVAQLAAASDRACVRAVGATFVRPVLVGRSLHITVSDGPGDMVGVTAAQDRRAVIRDGYARVRPGSWLSTPPGSPRR
jgi:acyl dehydratase